MCVVSIACHSISLFSCIFSTLTLNSVDSKHTLKNEEELCIGKKLCLHIRPAPSNAPIENSVRVNVQFDDSVSLSSRRYYVLCVLLTRE